MSAWLRITVEVEIECPDDTTSEAAEQYVTTTKGKVMEALPNAVDVSIADWSLDR